MTMIWKTIASKSTKPGGDHSFCLHIIRSNVTVRCVRRKWVNKKNRFAGNHFVSSFRTHIFRAFVRSFDMQTKKILLPILQQFTPEFERFFCSYVLSNNIDEHVFGADTVTMAVGRCDLLLFNQIKRRKSLHSFASFTEYYLLFFTRISKRQKALVSAIVDRLRRTGFI